MFLPEKTQNKADYHKYPSGKEVMKALNGNDVIFADSKGVLFQIKKNQILIEYTLLLLHGGTRKIEEMVKKLA